MTRTLAGERKRAVLRRAWLSSVAVAAMSTCAGLGWSSGALAQAVPQVAPQGIPVQIVQPGPDDALALDTITVVATKTEQLAIDTLAGVSVLREDQLEPLMASRMSELFTGMPGTTALQNANSSGTSINIRGLQDFGRVAVIVDGARQDFTQLGHANQAGSFFLEPGLVAGVDVVRGPVSNIFGSGAIGGVVTLRTKDANDIILPGNTWGVEANSEFGSNGPMGFGSLFAATHIGQNVDVFAGGTYRSQSDYKDGNGDVVQNSGYDTWTGIAKVTVRPADFHEVKVTALNYDSSYTTSDGVVTPTSTQYATDVTNRTVTGSWKYSNPDDNLFDWRSSVYWNQVALDQTKVAGSSNLITGAVGNPRSFTIDTVGFDVNNTSRFDWGVVRNAVTIGGDYFHDDVSNIDNYGFGDGYNPSGERGVGGGFVQWQANYSTWFQAIAGLRYDSYELSGDGTTNSGDHLSPKLTIGLTPLPWFTFYGTYAEGYRAPSVTEALVAGPHPAVFPGGAAPFSFVPNPNLQAEIGKNKELGVNIKYDDLFTKGDKVRIKANIYRNDVENYIDLVTYGPTSCLVTLPSFVRCPAALQNPYSLAQYQNVAEAQLEGFEFEGNYDAGGWFAGLSGQTSSGKATAGPTSGQPLASVPPDQITSTVGLRFMERKLSLALRWTAVAAKTAEDLPTNSVYDPSPSFNLVSAYLGYQPSENVLMQLSVENLLNEQYTQFESFLPSAGLTVKGGLTIRFGGGAVAANTPARIVK
ncbi:TonB-dependent hemoglobin/transferrin/lactoferrin family receptor [Xanthobacter sp. VTT E-85241]|uniref:TonB-dependent hemoglobin/transferrin/lactoferrin family receptor n=1 Tax=Roseixanthobacter finlandensis TaxID=3119922 RepID=UPI003729AC0D